MPALEALELDGVPVAVSSHRRRRRMAIYVRDGQVELRVPVRHSRRQAREFLASSRRWIKRQLALRTAAPPPSFTPGSKVLFLGRERRLQVAIGPSPGVAQSGDELVVTVPSAGCATPGHLQATLHRFMVDEARLLLPRRTAELAPAVGVRPARVSIGRSRSSWGTCSPDGRIRYSWHLIKAPLPMIDSVVVHELCHLLVPDHSPRFWAQVAKHDPLFQESRRWFAAHADALIAWPAAGPA